MLAHFLPPVSQGIYYYSLSIATHYKRITFVNWTQLICKDGSITCPFCRNTFIKEDASSLPTNSYVLHMLNQLNKEKKVAEAFKTSQQ